MAVFLAILLVHIIQGNSYVYPSVTVREKFLNDLTVALSAGKHL